MSNNYIRDSVWESVWESVYQPLWETVWNKEEFLDARHSILNPVFSSINNSISNTACVVCFEIIEETNNE